MTFAAKIPLIKIGYYVQLAFPTPAIALEFMNLLGQSVRVNDDRFSHSKTTGQSHFLHEEQEAPELSFIMANKFNGHQTSDEATAAWEAAQREPEDFSGGTLIPEPVLLNAPPADDIPF